MSSKQAEVDLYPPAYSDICTDPRYPPASGYSHQPGPHPPYQQQPYQQQPHPQAAYPQQYSTQQYVAQPYSSAQPYPGQTQQVGGQPVVITQQPIMASQITQQPIMVTQMGQMPLSAPPDDYMGASIFATICCCWLIGIFAIMKSAECRNAIQRGDHNLALQKSAEAKNMVKLTIGLGILTTVIVVVIGGVYIGILY